MRCNCNSAYGSGALDEGPVPKLAGRPLQLGLRVHHDRRRVPEAVFLRRAETGFLLLRPGPLPRRPSRASGGALADQGFAAIDFLFDQDTEGPPQCAFGSRAEVIGTCGVRQLFPNKQTCCAACGRSDKGQNWTISRARLDDKAEIVAWDQVIVGQSFMKGSPFEAGMIEDGVDQTYGRRGEHAA